MGARGNSLDPLFQSARTQGLFGPYDAKLVTALELLVDWVSADRVGRGDTHTSTRILVRKTRGWRFAWSPLSSYDWKERCRERSGDRRPGSNGHLRKGGGWIEGGCERTLIHLKQRFHLKRSNRADTT
jgi:hypothetical protein